MTAGTGFATLYSQQRVAAILHWERSGAPKKEAEHALTSALSTVILSEVRGTSASLRMTRVLKAVFGMVGSKIGQTPEARPSARPGSSALPCGAREATS